jgi:hypothetical protein
MFMSLTIPHSHPENYVNVSERAKGGACLRVNDGKHNVQDQKCLVVVPTCDVHSLDQSDTTGDGSNCAPL